MTADAPRDLASTPGDDVSVPAAVRRLARGAVPRPVWQNALGGLTYSLPGRYVKWAPPGVDLRPERERLAWAGEYTPVPRVLEHGTDPTGSWLVTAALPGRSAVDPRWAAEPARAADAIGEGLRALHDTLPVGGCPFSWEVWDRLAGLHDPQDPARFAAEFGIDAAAARLILADPPEVDRVVCHGDACAPNTLVDDDGRWAAHVDLGSLGTGDRWADLAVAGWSTEWNYGPGWEPRVLAAYGVAPDPDRTLYYRLLWELT